MTQPALNRDFLEMIRALIDADAEFLVVGAHAMAVHGVPRATGDGRAQSSGVRRSLA